MKEKKVVTFVSSKRSKEEKGWGGGSFVEEPFPASVPMFYLYTYFLKQVKQN